jgi:putative ABC transport system permease protein
MSNWKDEIRQHLSELKLSPTREEEIAEELSHELEDRYQRLLLDGHSPDEARAIVLQELAANRDWTNNLRRVEKMPRLEPVAFGSESNSHFISDFWLDLRYAFRVLIKNPGFTLVAIIALALGIGANSAIFSVVNTVLLRPLPYKDPDRLMMVWEDSSRHGYPRDTPAPANFIDWRDQNQTFEGLAAIADTTLNLTGNGDPERLEGRRVSANLFPLLGVEPQLGRTFTPDEDKPGNQRVVVLSHSLWQRRFAGGNNVVGQAITLNGESAVVVGVMPARFQFPTPNDQFWVPIAFTPEAAAARGSHYLQVVGRLKPGVAIESAQADMTSIATRLQQQYPQSNTELGAVVVPLHENILGDIRKPLLILLGAVGLVLLIACANVANLLLARATMRQKEIAVRVALGASRWRIVRQLLTESVLLSATAGVLGLVISFVGLLLLRAFIPETISQAKEVSLDPKVLGFTLGVSVLTGLIFGLAPAIQASRLGQSETLKETGRDSVTSTSGNRIRSLLVVAEVALSLILLVGAGLLINSFLRLKNVDPGFRADNLLTMKVVLPEPRYREFDKRSAFYKDLLQRLQAVPGVSSAAVTTNLPLYRQGNSIGILIEGRPEPQPGQELIVVTRVVSPSYLETMGIQLLKGRFLSEQDEASGQRVVVISEAMANKFWPGEDAIGKRLSGGRVNSQQDWRQVVGVVRDVRQFDLQAAPRPQMYLSYKQAGFFAPRDLVVKTTVEPSSLVSAVRKTVWEIDKDQPVASISTMDTILSESIGRQRFSMLLLAIFAGIALVLAAVGIYSVMNYSVTRRTQEIGIRMALGAQRGAVLRLAIGRELKLVVIGLVIGIGSSLLLTRLMASLLFGVTPTDPITFVSISLVLVLTALVASYLPARRASKVDPIVALRFQ